MFGRLHENDPECAPFAQKIMLTRTATLSDDRILIRVRAGRRGDFFVSAHPGGGAGGVLHCRKAAHDCLCDWFYLVSARFFRMRGDARLHVSLRSFNPMF